MDETKPELQLLRAATHTTKIGLSGKCSVCFKTVDNDKIMTGIDIYGREFCMECPEKASAMRIADYKENSIYKLCCLPSCIEPVISLRRTHCTKTHSDACPNH